MKILFLRNPLFATSPSMERFARMVIEGCAKRGHEIRSITAAPHAANLSVWPFSKKWLGYIDKFVVFRNQLKAASVSLSPETLVVALDQALGPWLPFFKGKPRATHVHDLLSIRAALGEFEHVSTSLTGKIYNHFIKRGLESCGSFICVSEATKADVNRLLRCPRKHTRVIYNGLSASFCPGDTNKARVEVAKHCGRELSKGYHLHVGGDTWYKNRIGVVRLYSAWRQATQVKVPLLMVGPSPSGELAKVIAATQCKDDIVFKEQVDEALLVSIYQGASALLFPSLAEGFGWPIAEASACGCPVVTTGIPPMTEVGGSFAEYIPVMPYANSRVSDWAQMAVPSISLALSRKNEKSSELARAASAAQTKFSTEKAIDEIEMAYLQIIQAHAGK